MSVHDELQRARARVEQENRKRPWGVRLIAFLIGVLAFVKTEGWYIYGIATGKITFSVLTLLATFAIVALIFLIAWWQIHRHRTRRLELERRRGDTA